VQLQVCSLLGTSRESHNKLALDAHVKRHKRIALAKRKQLEAAIRNNVHSTAAELKAITDLQKEFAELEKKVDTELKAAKLNPTLAEASLRLEHHLPALSRTMEPGVSGPLLFTTLQEVRIEQILTNFSLVKKENCY
jgi:C4-dicarboxylate-specific signal transduction histidine kinase